MEYVVGLAIRYTRKHSGRGESLRNTRRALGDNRDVMKEGFREVILEACEQQLAIEHQEVKLCAECKLQGRKEILKWVSRSKRDDCNEEGMQWAITILNK